MSLLSKPSDLVMDRAEQAVDLVATAVVPIFRRDERKCPDFEGSGVLLRFGARSFLVSAAHVFDACSDQPFLLLDGAERTPLASRPTKTTIPAGRRREDDRVDIGFVELTDAEVLALGATNFIEPTHLNVNDAHARGGQYFLFGFPGKLQLRDHNERVIRTHGAYFVSLEAEKRGYQFCSVIRDTHLLLSYRDDRLVKRSSGPVPSLRGMSGGGVWRFNALQQQRPDNRPRLVAIMTERPDCYGPCLMCTRVELVLAGVRRKYPELADLIPPSRFVKVTVDVEDRELDQISD